ncbi:MAG: DUF4249 domain-containing protein [Bacteroidia bacterium]|nr:DUF4249 domain-containing protein [Bacteroidia bacterium]
MNHISRFLLLITLAGGSMSCDETFQLNAPYQDIFAVYGVLNPHVDTQYVRISLAFQLEEDAIAYAKTHDASVPGLEVIISGAGQTLLGKWVDSIPKIGDGDFATTTGAYRFVAEELLTPGELYQLDVRKADEPDFFLRAQTRIPPAPRIISPSRFSTQGEYCLPMVDVEDTVSVLFRRNDQPDNQASHFEVRWVLRYEKDGQQLEVATRPSPIFNNNVRCSFAGRGNICFSTGNGSVVKEWKVDVPEEGRAIPLAVRCSRIPIELSRNAEIQVTALDTVLASYILVNDPRQLNLNTIRQEYTNVQGSARAVGVFGSIAYDNEPFILSDCAESLLELNEIPAVLTCR